MPNRPIIFALEGVNYSGKSTISKMLSERLDIQLIKQPYTEPVRTLIYTSLQHSEYSKQLPMLFTADRLLIECDIISATNSKGILYDRSTWSNAHHEGATVESVLEYAQFEQSLGITLPDVVFYIKRDTLTCDNSDVQSTLTRQLEAEEIYDKLAQMLCWQVIENREGELEYAVDQIYTIIRLMMLYGL